jgi:hypothetical protein
MRKKGVDTAQIDPIEAQRAAVEKDLQMVKNVTELVQQYRHQLRKRRPMHLKWLAESQQSSVIAPEAYAAYGRSGPRGTNVASRSRPQRRMLDKASNR